MYACVRCAARTPDSPPLPSTFVHTRTRAQVDRYGKGPVWRSNFWPILGDGIFSADFDNWLTQRKVRASVCGYVVWGLD